MSVTRPIPAFYAVYILRSTRRPASLYIGSTPDPPRRLKQHNKEIMGGAKRTAKENLLPWEMVGLVSGFPGALAALKFEWALTNPHVSLHIPSASRISVPQRRKGRGRPRRPVPTMKSVLANVHLLLRVPSFARWPLRLHVFAADVWVAWQATETDPAVPAVAECDEGSDTPQGIDALPLDYEPLRDYADKARGIFTLEREGECTLCREPLPSGQGLYVVCPNGGCEAVGHLDCWSRQVLASETDAVRRGVLLPQEGNCPSCGGLVVWVDMMKELTLRLRAPQEVDRLVKAKRREEAKEEKKRKQEEKEREKEKKREEREKEKGKGKGKEKKEKGKKKAKDKDTDKEKNSRASPKPRRTGAAKAMDVG